MKEEDKNQERLSFSFEQIYQQNKNRIHYQILKLGINDPNQDYFSEGLFAMWHAYQRFNPDKGPLATYFNFVIRNRLIDKIRKETRVREHQENYLQMAKIDLEDGNKFGLMKQTVVAKAEVNLPDKHFWQKLKRKLTVKQWCWVEGSIIKGLTNKEIAAREGVTEEAVKSWSRSAKERLKRELTIEEIFT